MVWQSLTAQTLFEQLPEAAMVVDVDGCVVTTNPRADDLFDIDAQAPDLTVVDLLTQPERARLNPLAWLQKWADTPEAPELDYVYLTCKTRNGRERQLAIRVSRIRDDQSRAFYLVTLRDISTWEERLRRERDAHRLAARVLAISADAVLTINSLYQIVYANRSAEDLFGYPQGALMGKPLSLLIPPRFRTSHEDYIRDFANEAAPSRLMSDRKAITGLTSDGTEIPDRSVHYPGDVT